MKKKKVLKLILIVCVIILIIYIIKPYYKVENRIDKINEFSMDNTNSNPLGWLRIQGTNIDFPIMYYYDIEDDIENPNYNIGWNFENQTKLSNRSVILSHNVLNVSNKPLIANKNHHRFEQLMSFIYYDFVKKNKYVQYTIDKKNYLFKIYAVYLDKEENLNFDNIKTTQKKSYISQAEKNSYFDFDVDVNKKDKLLTLITCTRFYGNKDYSFVIEARKVRKKELKINYKVTKKNNYKGIEKILNGDESNE